MKDHIYICVCLSECVYVNIHLGMAKVNSARQVHTVLYAVNCHQNKL